jgi:dolichol-phosphate mannosyltransferase
MNNRYTIILPTLNEAGHISDLVFDIYKVLSKKNAKHEIFIIDDNSCDGTQEKILSIKKTNPEIDLNLIVRSNKKRSLVESLNLGILKSKYENIIWMDADYSHPPQYINEFLERNSEKIYDAMIFSRFILGSKRYFEIKKKRSLPIDNLSIILNKICQIFINREVTDYTSGYICIKKEILLGNTLTGYYGDYFIYLITDLLIKRKAIKELPYIEQDRASGNSKTTGDKFDFILKCLNYFLVVLRCSIKYRLKLFFNK